MESSPTHEALTTGSLLPKAVRKDVLVSQAEESTDHVSASVRTAAYERYRPGPVSRGLSTELISSRFDVIE